MSETTKPLELAKPGTLVFLGTDYLIEGRIEQVAIQRKNMVLYEVSWWAGREHRKDWFSWEHLRIRTEEQSTAYMKVGFQ